MLYHLPTIPSSTVVHFICLFWFVVGLSWRVTFGQILKKLQGELVGVLSGEQAPPVEYPWVDHPQAGTRLEGLPPESKGSPMLFR